MEFLATLLQAVIAAAVPVLAAFAARLLNAKTDEAQLKIKNTTLSNAVGQAALAASAAVAYVAQTYVDKLKEAGKFSAEKQKEALAEALVTAKQLLTLDAQNILLQAYGSVSTYLEKLIEAEIKEKKRG